MNRKIPELKRRNVYCRCITLCGGSLQHNKTEKIDRSMQTETIHTAPFRAAHVSYCLNDVTYRAIYSGELSKCSFTLQNISVNDVIQMLSVLESFSSHFFPLLILHDGIMEKCFGPPNKMKRPIT